MERICNFSPFTSSVTVLGHTFPVHHTVKCVTVDAHGRVQEWPIPSPVFDKDSGQWVSDYLIGTSVGIMTPYYGHEKEELVCKVDVIVG